MQGSEASAVDTEHPRPWSWLKNPWLLLIIGGTTALILWMGCGVWIEHRRAKVLAELQATPGIEVTCFGIGRYPIWMPAWLGDQTHEVWDSRIVDEPLFVDVLEPPTERQLNLLLRLPLIRTIRFGENSNVSDEALRTLCESQHIEAFDFDRPRQLTHQQYEALSRNPNLKELLQIKGPFDQAAVQALGHMQHITQLKLVGPLSDTVRATDLGQLTHLWCLDWDDSQLTDEQVSDLAGFPSLRYLILHKTLLTGKSWAALGSLHIQLLYLDSPYIDDRLADELARISEITTLKLRGGQFSDQALRKLLESSSLESMNTETRELSLDTAKLIGNSASLVSLAVRGSPQIDDQILKAIVHGQMSGLNILNSSITDAGVEYLRLCSASLRSLGLANSRITDRSVGTLSELEHVRSLDLRNTAITDDGLRQYSQATNFFSLERLHLGGTQVSAAVVKELMEKHLLLVVYGVDGIEAGDDADPWFRPLDASERP